MKSVNGLLLLCARKRRAKSILTLSLCFILSFLGFFSKAEVNRPLPPEFFNSRAICYSPFRTGNFFTETLEKTKILEDLKLLSQADFKLIRLFSSHDKLARIILEVISENNLDIKVFLGLYIQSHSKLDSPKQLDLIEKLNRTEIFSAVALANKYKDLVLAVSVGNQNLSGWSNNLLTVAELSKYLDQVRRQIRQPVTTDDSWSFYAKASKDFLQRIDFLAVHSYPFVDRKHNELKLGQFANRSDTKPEANSLIDTALGSLDSQINEVRDHLQKNQFSNLPVIIGETGWKATPTDGEYDYASQPLQKLYYDQLELYKKNYKEKLSPQFNIFYFSAFDEPAKRGDDGWGFFDVHRNPRLVLQTYFVSKDNTSGDQMRGGSSPRSALDYKLGYLDTKNELWNSVFIFFSSVVIFAFFYKFWLKVY